MVEPLILQVDSPQLFRDFGAGYQEWQAWAIGLSTAVLGLLLLSFLAKSISRLF